MRTDEIRVQTVKEIIGNKKSIKVIKSVDECRFPLSKRTIRILKRNMFDNLCRVRHLNRQNERPMGLSYWSNSQCEKLFVNFDDFLF